jgi:hypothetical protein
MAAHDEARMLAMRGLDFDAIVERLEREKGLDHASARAAAARALSPDPSPDVSLAAELAEIVASLDRSS